MLIKSLLSSKHVLARAAGPLAGLALLPMFQPMLRMLLNPAFHAVGHFIGALIGSAA